VKNARLFTRRVGVFFILTVVINLIFVISSDAQAPVANFTANVTSGCSPLIVQFTDLSTNNPTSWAWDLGNGSTASVKNPTTSYVNPGTYTITLTATNASGSTTKTSTITVNQSPVAKFTSTDTSGCTPHTVTFTDQSTSASGNITQWEWNFGDGVTSNLQNPSHVYNTSGTYNVVLKVTTAAGCSQTLFKQQYIRAGAGAQADFIANIPNYCQAPVTINFTNNSQVDAGATYSWNFGDGNTSTAVNPTHTYNSTGNFNVTLTVQSPDGCNATRQQSIDLAGKNVSFTGPATVCAGSAASFQMNSSPAPVSQTWNMGDGTTYSTATISHTYTTAGTYTITLTNEFTGGCVATKTQTVTVIAGAAIDFKADTTKACKAPFTVNFQPIGATSAFSWDFGDGTTSTLQNPSHTYQAGGNFTVILSAMNANGCVGSVQKTGYIKIQPPTISISNLPVNDGCTPYSFTPAANIIATEGIASYFWDFGNGNTSTGSNPSYTYTTPGSYTIKLRVQTNGGCVDSVTYPNAVNISNGTNLDFTATPTAACVDQPVMFNSITSASPSSYEWNFGDNIISTLASPGHSYKLAGIYTVSLMVKYGNCTSKITKENYVNVQPPEARFSAVGDCNNRRLINFTNQSIGTGNYLWNFGDGTTSTVASPSHLYATDGSYTVTFTVNNGTCSHTLTDTIEVSSAAINFVSNATIVCKGELFTLKATVPNTISVSQYEWTIPNSNILSAPVDTMQWILYNAGVYDVTLKITTVNGCVETITKSNYLTVYGPTADFISDKPGGCENTTIIFADSSASDGLHSITQWEWDFGDASPAVSGSTASHSFSNAGLYQVSLKVTDTYGCSDTRSKSNFVAISNGKAMFTALDSLGCMGKDVIFQDTSTGNIANWEWSFGDGTGAVGVQNPSHSYTDSGYYAVKLKITETSGCTDSITKTNYITIKNPVAKFGLSDTFSTCPPLTVTFSDSSYYAKKWLWDFADGGSSPVASPINLYTIPGVYDVKLTVTSHGGCTDSAFGRIRILGPYGQFNYSPLVGCTPLMVNYNISSSQAVKFLWDFSDGFVDSGTVATNAHTYLSGGKFVPKVILTDASGCSVPVTGQDTIYIEKTILDFSASQQTLCDSGTISFTNLSEVKAPSVTYEWRFVNSSVIAENATNTFLVPGTYDVTLMSTTSRGCRDTLTKQAFIRVHNSPVATIISEDSLCKPASFNFSAQLAPDTSTIRSWKWTFGNGQTDTLQNPPAQSFPNDGSFENTLLIHDNDGCSTAVSKAVTVHPLPVVQAQKSEIICRDDSTQLSASGAISYSWIAPNNNLSCIDCPDPIASPQQDVTYKVEGTSALGCKAYDSVTIKVFQPYKISVESFKDSLCLGRTTQIKALGAPLYIWSPATGLSSTAISNPFASPATSTIYKVIGFDSLGCFRDSLEVPIVVLDSPAVNAGPDIVLSAGTTGNIQATASADVVRYQWFPATGLSCTDCANPTVTAGGNITYTVRVSNSVGCTTEDQVKVIVTCNETNLFIPNTFTPNGDGMNDVFYVRGKGVYAVKSLKVFNRWGELLFEKKDVTSNNPSDGWDGMFKGTIASTDTYIYQVEVMCSNTEVLKYNGTISLIR
jgi:gliding motility-associated-like protein